MNGNEVFLATGLTVPAGRPAPPGRSCSTTTNLATGTYHAYARRQRRRELAFHHGHVAGGDRGRAGRLGARGPRPPFRCSSRCRTSACRALDTVTAGYQYTDPDSTVTVTLLLDKDRNPNNDDINNPGDPSDPNTNIIILPNAARKATDPTFGGDPPPPDDPNNPPNNVDSVEVRRNPRILPATTSGLPPPVKTYLFDIDFSRIPPRPDGKPYFIRATINDGVSPLAHSYAVGSLTITSLARGTVDLDDVGFLIAGARLQGFSAGEFLGTGAIPVGDIDNDTVDDFLVTARFASPRNRNQAGGAYLFFGRRKTPYPPDTNGNGRPDVRDATGAVVDFPAPPLFIFDPNVLGNVSPYDPRVVGRYGGRISVNSIGTLVNGSFYRGTVYIAPLPLGPDQPPVTQQDIDHPGLATSGLTSVTQINLTGLDGGLRIPDLVFGLPWVSHPREYHDDDPCDQPGNYGDGLPNPFSDQFGNDDMAFHETFPIDTGLAIMVSGANDLANTFRNFVDIGISGQFDPLPIVDDEGLVHGRPTIPDGARLRGAWQTSSTSPPLEPTNEFGADVATLPTIDNDLEPELAVSAPGTSNNTGAVFIFNGQDFRDPIFYADPVLSLPSYTQTQNCNLPVRALLGEPVSIRLNGAQPGDRLGHPRSAGDFNQDGKPDVLCGSPTADRDGHTDNGVLYLLFTPSGGFGNATLPVDYATSANPPRLEIHSIHDGDRLGEVHDNVGDINGDGVADVAFGMQFYDDDNRGNPDAGFVGVIFGDRQATGQFVPEDVGSPALPGVRFFGPTIGARAGASVSGAGDFNRDGLGDLLICAPGEIRRAPDGTNRKGVAYVILGGGHLVTNGPSFNLSEVGSARLPGIVFLSPYIVGSQDEATIETVAGVGDCRQRRL
ncbi:MAG: VCBS repeat-containing protein [Phycisphaerae bacterium]